MPNSYDEFIIFLFYSGFNIEFEWSNNLKRIKINTDSSLDLIIDQFGYEELIVRFIKYSEFDFIFDTYDHDGFTKSLKDAFIKFNEATGYDIQLPDFSLMK